VALNTCLRKRGRSMSRRWKHATSKKKKARYKPQKGRAKKKNDYVGKLREKMQNEKCPRAGQHAEK